MQPTDAGYPQQKRQHPCITQCLKACIHTSGLLFCFTADQRQNRRTAHKANRQCKQGQPGFRHCASSSPVCAEAEPPETWLLSLRRPAPCCLHGRSQSQPAPQAGCTNVSAPHTQGSAAFAMFFQPEQLFNGVLCHDKEAMPQAPDDKVQFAPCHSPVQKNTISLFSKSLPCPSGCRPMGLQVFPEPSGKGDMPSAPEFLNTGRDVRIVEVFLEVEPKAQAQPMAISLYPLKSK